MNTFDPAAPLQAILSPAELELFLSSIPAQGTVLEFGAGGSTKIFMEKGVSRLFSVESDLNWIKHMMHDAAIQKGLAQKKLSFLYADIGPTVAYGAPARKDPEVSWLRYHRDVWRVIPGDEVRHVLIDGRFRVACTLQCLLRCRPDTSIFIHDFNNRPHYHQLLEYLEVQASADTAVACRIKADLDLKKLALDLQTFDFDQR